MAERICTIEGCKRKHTSRGYCRVHYKHWWRYGDPLAGNFEQSESVRFWSKVDKAGDCWEWTAGTWRSRGHAVYGQFTLTGGKKICAHRYAYMEVNGDIPEGHQIDHRCHNTLCVNPSHLRVATNKQNHENRLGPTSRNTSGQLGVSWCRKGRKWVASVGHNGKVWNRRFSTYSEAVEAVRAKRIELFTHNDADREARLNVDAS